MIGYDESRPGICRTQPVEEARATINTALQHKASTPDFHIGLAKLDWAEGKDVDMENELQVLPGRPREPWA